MACVYFFAGALPEMVRVVRTPAPRFLRRRGFQRSGSTARRMYSAAQSARAETIQNCQSWVGKTKVPVAQAAKVGDRRLLRCDGRESDDVVGAVEGHVHAAVGSDGDVADAANAVQDLFTLHDAEA